MSEKSQAIDVRIQELIRLLGDFSTRAGARRQLLAIGEPAVDALVKALDSPLEGVAWSAAKTLGELGSQEAVEALGKALSRPAVEMVAREALQKITGRSVAAGVPADESLAASTAALSDEQLAAALSGDTISCRKRSGGYTMGVLLPGGRRQDVEMMLSIKDRDGSPMVAFYTECGAAEPELYERALKLNLRIPFGAFALRESGDEKKLVMVDAYLRESADVKQLRKALSMLARRADQMEKQLSDTDEY